MTPPTPPQSVGEKIADTWASGVCLTAEQENRVMGFQKEELFILAQCIDFAFCAAVGEERERISKIIGGMFGGHDAFMNVIRDGREKLIDNPEQKP